MRTKTIIAAGVLVFFSVGCHSGNVTVNPIEGPGNSNPQSKDKNKPKPRPKPKPKPQPGDSDEDKDAGNLFFTTVAFPQDSGMVATGIGYLNLDNERSPITATIQIRQGIPLMVPLNGGVIYVRPANINQDKISFMSPDNLSHRDLLLASGRIQFITVSDDQSLLGWVDDKGGGHLLSLKARHTKIVTVSQFKIKKMQIQVKTGRILIIGSNAENSNEVRILNLADNQEIFKVNADDGALEGESLAIIQDNGAASMLSVVRARYPVVSRMIIYQDQTRRIFQPRWAKSGWLAFGVKGEAGQAKLNVSNLKTKRTSLVTTISTPVEAVENTLCPSWLGSDLYFGGFLNGQFVIMKSHRIDSQWQTTAVVAPETSDMGFVCPIAIEENNL